MKKVEDLKAAICEKGHIETSTLKISEDFNKKYCNKCGEKILISCPHCGEYIPGGHIEVDSNPDFALINGPQYVDECELPSYCHECGKAYPWVQSFLDDYKEILELQSEELESELQEKIYSATEKAIKNKFEGVSLNILKLTLDKVTDTVHPTLINVLSNIATSKVIDYLK